MRAGQRAGSDWEVGVVAGRAAANAERGTMNAERAAQAARAKGNAAGSRRRRGMGLPSSGPGVSGQLAGEGISDFGGADDGGGGRAGRCHAGLGDVGVGRALPRRAR